MLFVTGFVWIARKTKAKDGKHLGMKGNVNTIPENELKLHSYHCHAMEMCSFPTSPLQGLVYFILRIYCPTSLVFASSQKTCVFQGSAIAF